MKSISFTVLSCVLSSCVVHLHIHEAPKVPDAAQAQSQTARPADSTTTAVVSGVAVDSAGNTVAAHVSAVGSTGGGSNSVGTNEDGRFEISKIYWPEVVLHASTKDGRVAVRSVRTGATGLKLVLTPGATIVIDLAGQDHTRCAVFQGELRMEDFTLRTGQPATVVVPAGDLRVRLYDGDKTYEEQSVSVAEGSTKAVAFRIGS